MMDFTTHRLMMASAGINTAPVAFTIELWGGKGGDYTFFSDYFSGNDPWGVVPSPDDPNRKGGSGGYYSLNMVVPSNHILQLKPGWHPGGASVSGAPAGGASSGFSIKNEWMCVVGGGGGASADWSYDSDPFYIFGGITGRFLTFRVISGKTGGIPSPSTTLFNGNAIASKRCFNNDGDILDQSINGEVIYGGGGGGVPGGTASQDECTGLYYQTLPISYASGAPAGTSRIRSNYLEYFPDVSMTPTPGASSDYSGTPKIRVTNKETGNFREYTSFTDVRVSAIKRF